jgi:hypothetical protein
MKTRHFIWIFSILIIFQSLWINFRVQDLKLRQPALYPVQGQRVTQDQLASVPEPEIEEQLPKGGSLEIIPKEAGFSTPFSLEVWAETEQPVEEVDLKVFYPSSVVRAVNYNGVQINDAGGYIVYSTEFMSPRQGRFLVTNLRFEPLKTGIAKIEFDFNPQSQLDTNLLNSEGADILESASGASINVEKTGQ